MRTWIWNQQEKYLQKSYAHSPELSSQNLSFKSVSYRSLPCTYETPVPLSGLIIKDRVRHEYEPSQI